MGLSRGRQLGLGLLGRLVEPLERLRIIAQIDSVVGLEVVGQPIDDAAVEVVATEVGVACGGPHFDHTVADVEHTDIEGAAAEVEHEDGLGVGLVEPVGQRRCGRLVDDAQHVDAGDLACVLGCLPLRIVEVRRHGDHRFGHLLADELRGVVDELADDLRRDFFRGMGSAIEAKRTTPSGPSSTSNDTVPRSCSTSSKRRPMKRLAEAIVPFGLRTAWRRASWPTRREPSLVKATIDGVVRDPSAFGTIVGWPPSMIATTEFVVPKSIPTARPTTGPPRFVRAALISYSLRRTYGWRINRRNRRRQRQINRAARAPSDAGAAPTLGPYHYSPFGGEFMSSIDLKKTYRNHYRAKATPEVVEVPTRRFLMIDGAGDPNTSAEYANAIEALYPLAYGLRAAVKSATGDAYTVMPLEGLWWVENMAEFDPADKSNWQWAAMICVPEIVTPAMADEILPQVTARKDLIAGSKARVETYAEGQAAQVLHVGPYSEEAPTIAALHAFIAEQGGRLTGRHHEIYLSDARKTDPAKLRTIIRQPFADD